MRCSFSHAEEIFKVRLPKELVFLDVFHSTLKIAVTLGEIMLAKLLNEALSILIEATWKSEWLAEDLLEDLIWVISHKRWSTVHHLVHEDAEGIPINSM